MVERLSSLTPLEFCLWWRSLRNYLKLKNTIFSHNTIRLQEVRMHVWVEIFTTWFFFVKKIRSVQPTSPFGSTWTFILSQETISFLCKYTFRYVNCNSMLYAGKRYVDKSNISSFLLASNLGSFVATLFQFLQLFFLWVFSCLHKHPLRWSN